MQYKQTAIINSDFLCFTLRKLALMFFNISAIYSVIIAGLVKYPREAQFDKVLFEQNILGYSQFIKFQQLTPIFYIINLNCLQRMSTYSDESTNCMTNPFTRNKNFSKQKLINQTNSQSFPQQNSKTIAFHNILINQGIDEITVKPGKMLKKMRVPQQQIQSSKAEGFEKEKVTLSQILLQQTITKNIKRKSSLTRLMKVNFTQNSKNEPNSHVKQAMQQAIPGVIEIPQANPKIAQILSGTSLRQKYSCLIPPAHQHPISYEHQHLLKIISVIDETIEFSNKNRALKFIFFQELKNKIKNSLRIFIELSHIEQLLYLNQNLYEVKWQWSYQKKGHDIMIVLPKVKSRDQRKTQVRQIIVNFLNEKYQQFIKTKNFKISKRDNKWHPDFQPSKYQIPRKTLPSHPEIRDAEIRSLDQNKINDIKNQNLKRLIQKQKQKQKAQSFKPKTAMDMILSGNSKDLEKNLMAAVKEKEIQMKKKKEQQETRVQKQKTSVTGAILKQLAQNILLIYISKNVTNIFKVKLIEILQERIKNKYSSPIVDKHLGHLIQLKDIGYLKEIYPSHNKPTIVQINKSKIKQIVSYADGLTEKQKSEHQTF